MVDRLARLRDLADRLETRVAAAEDKEASALAGQLMKALEQIEGIEQRAPVSGSTVDEIAARRKKRRRPVKNGVAREQS